MDDGKRAYENKQKEEPEIILQVITQERKGEHKNGQHENKKKSKRPQAPALGGTKQEMKERKKSKAHTDVVVVVAEPAQQLHQATSSSPS